MERLLQSSECLMLKGVWNEVGLLNFCVKSKIYCVIYSVPLQSYVTYANSLMNKSEKCNKQWCFSNVLDFYCSKGMNFFCIGNPFSGIKGSWPSEGDRKNSGDWNVNINVLVEPINVFQFCSRTLENKFEQKQFDQKPMLIKKGIRKPIRTKNIWSKKRFSSCDQRMFFFYRKLDLFIRTKKYWSETYSNKKNLIENQFEQNTSLIDKDLKW